MTGVDIRRSFRKTNPAGTELAPRLEGGNKTTAEKTIGDELRRKRNGTF